MPRPGGAVTTWRPSAGDRLLVYTLNTDMGG